MLHARTWIRKAHTCTSICDFLLVVHADSQQPNDTSLVQQFINVTSIPQEKFSILHTQEAVLSEKQLAIVRRGFIIFSDAQTWNIMQRQISFTGEIDFKQGKKVFALKAPPLTASQALWSAIRQRLS